MLHFQVKNLHKKAISFVYNLTPYSRVPSYRRFSAINLLFKILKNNPEENFFGVWYSIKFFKEINSAGPKPSEGNEDL